MALEKGEAPLTPISVLDQDIQRAIFNKEAVLAVFLDTEKAYDSLWRRGCTN